MEIPISISDRAQDSVVAIVWHPRGERDRLGIGTGFIVAADGRWFLLTAVHIVEEVVKLSDASTIVFAIQSVKSNDKRVDILFKKERFFGFDQDSRQPSIESGINDLTDICIMELTELERSAIETDAVLPLSVSELLTKDLEVQERIVPCLFCAGFRFSELEIYEKYTQMHLEIIPARVTKLGDITQAEVWAQIFSNGSDLDWDIRGMSGGPLFVEIDFVPYVVGHLISQKRGAETKIKFVDSRIARMFVESYLEIVGSTK